MALIVRDRIRDTTTTTGAATITLSGTAPLRYKNFASVLATNDTFPYAIVHQSVGVDEWEVGVGTLNSSTTFTRTTVVAGTNGTSAVVFSAGTKDVMMVDLADPLTLRTITGTAGQITVTNGDGVAGDPTIAFATGLATLPTVQSFLSGSGTYTTPANVKWIRVRMVGGGGGGAGGGTAAGTAAGTGGNTTFGTTLLVANGGVGGTWASTSAAGGAGGTASLGSGPVGIAVSGGDGGPGMLNTGSTAVWCIGSAGGASAFGGAGTGGLGAGLAASPNTGAGGGGGGGGAVVNAGSGTGGGSGGFVDAIITSPSATYSYAVGAAGTAGGTGTGGNAGAAGGSGMIIVEEYYNY